MSQSERRGREKRGETRARASAALPPQHSLTPLSLSLACTSPPPPPALSPRARSTLSRALLLSPSSRIPGHPRQAAHGVPDEAGRHLQGERGGGQREREVQRTAGGGAEREAGAWRHADLSPPPPPPPCRPCRPSPCWATCTSTGASPAPTWSSSPSRPCTTGSTSSRSGAPSSGRSSSTGTRPPGRSRRPPCWPGARTTCASPPLKWSSRKKPRSCRSSGSTLSWMRRTASRMRRACSSRWSSA